MKLLKFITIFVFILTLANSVQGQRLYEIPFDHVPVDPEASIFAHFNFDPARQLIICTTSSPMAPMEWASIQWHEKYVVLRPNHPAILKDIDPTGELEIGTGRGIHVSCSYSNKQVEISRASVL